MSVSSVASSSSASSSGKPTCTNCGTTEPWNGSSWCPVCGYYPTLNRAVPAAQAANQSFAEEEEDSTFPLWALVAIIGAVAILVSSVIIRIAVPEEVRGYIALSMIGLGMCSFAAAHVMAFVVAMKKTVTFGLFDVFVKPGEIWRFTFLNLPEGERKIWIAIWGLMALVCGPIVVGGIDYDALFKDWGVKKRKKVNLIAKVVGSAQVQSSGAESLEEAMEEFAGKAQVAGGVNGQGKPKSEEEEAEESLFDEEEEEEQQPPQNGMNDEGSAEDGAPEENADEDDAAGKDPREEAGQGASQQPGSAASSGGADQQKRNGDDEEDTEPGTEGDESDLSRNATDYLPAVECAIMGFCRDGQGLRCVIVAGVVNDELKCLGQVSVDSLPELRRTKLLNYLQTIQRSTPFIPTPFDGEWVVPKLRCRVAFTSLTRDGRLRSARIKELIPPDRDEDQTATPSPRAEATRSK